MDWRVRKPSVILVMAVWVEEMGQNPDFRGSEIELEKKKRQLKY